MPPPQTVAAMRKSVSMGNLHHYGSLGTALPPTPEYEDGGMEVEAGEGLEGGRGGYGSDDGLPSTRERKKGNIHSSSFLHR